jgi:CDP-diacylglycerol---glycerol-3-phosphate 3-phosphatidyltransferase
MISEVTTPLQQGNSAQSSVLNFPNALTLSRIPFLFVIVGLMAMDWVGAASLAFFLFIVAGVTDWLDGYYARRYNLISIFGKLMDALTDKILMVGLFVALIVFEMLPSSVLILSLFLLLMILSREFFITGLRLVAAANGLVLAAEKSGKQKTVSQILAMGCLLAAPMLVRDISPLIGVDLTGFGAIVQWVGFGLFVLAALLTATSGLTYLIKYRRQLFEQS